MSILLPYSFTKHANKYIFQTDNSVAYSVEFTDGTHYFLNLLPHIPVFEFNIKVLNVVDSIGQPYDERIEVKKQPYDSKNHFFLFAFFLKIFSKKVFLVSFSLTFSIVTVLSIEGVKAETKAFRSK